MKRATTIELFILLAPVIWGLAFIGAVKLGQELFLSGNADPIMAVLMEISTLSIGLLLALGQIGMLVRYLFKRRWIMAVLSIVTPPIWFACIATGVSMGAAIIYST